MGRAQQRYFFFSALLGWKTPFSTFFRFSVFSSISKSGGSAMSRSYEYRRVSKKEMSISTDKFIDGSFRGASSGVGKGGQYIEFFYLHVII